MMIYCSPRIALWEPVEEPVTRKLANTRRTSQAMEYYVAMKKEAAALYALDEGKSLDRLFGEKKEGAEQCG